MKINFGGKERGFQWGIGCIRRFCNLMDGGLETLEVLDDGSPFEKLDASVKLLLASLTTYCFLNDEVIDFNYDKVEAWLSDAPQSDMDSLIADFMESKFLGKSVQDYFSIDTEDIGVKKK